MTFTEKLDEPIHSRATHAAKPDCPADCLRPQAHVQHKNKLKATAQALNTRIEIALRRLRQRMAEANPPYALQKLHDSYVSLQLRILNALSSLNRLADHHILDEEFCLEHEQHMHHLESLHGVSHTDINDFLTIIRDYQNLLHNQHVPDDERSRLLFENSRVLMGGRHGHGHALFALISPEGAAHT